MAGRSGKGREIVSSCGLAGCGDATGAARLGGGSARRVGAGPVRCGRAIRARRGRMGSGRVGWRRARESSRAAGRAIGRSRSAATGPAWTDVVQSSNSSVDLLRRPVGGVPAAKEGKRSGSVRRAVTGSEEGRGISLGCREAAASWTWARRPGTLVTSLSNAGFRTAGPPGRPRTGPGEARGRCLDTAGWYSSTRAPSPRGTGPARRTEDVGCKHRTIGQRAEQRIRGPGSRPWRGGAAPTVERGALGARIRQFPGFGYMWVGASGERRIRPARSGCRPWSGGPR